MQKQCYCLLYAHLYSLDFADVAQSNVFDDAYGAILRYLEAGVPVVPGEMAAYMSLDGSWSAMVPGGIARHVYI